MNVVVQEVLGKALSPILFNACSGMSTLLSLRRESGHMDVDVSSCRTLYKICISRLVHICDISCVTVVPRA